MPYREPTHRGVAESGEPGPLEAQLRLLTSLVKSVWAEGELGASWTETPEDTEFAVIAHRRPWIRSSEVASDLLESFALSDRLIHSPSLDQTQRRGRRHASFGSRTPPRSGWSLADSR